MFATTLRCSSSEQQLQIERFARYIMTDQEVQQRLSENEVDHARK